MARTDKDHYKGISDSTTGILFLGTPHHGTSTGVTQEKIFERIISFQIPMQNEILKTIVRDSQLLVDTVDMFALGLVREKHPPKVYCFYEKKPCKISKWAGLEDGPLVSGKPSSHGQWLSF